MPKQAASLYLMTRVHAGDGSPDVQITLHPADPSNLESALAFQVPPEVGLLTRLNKASGVFVEHAEGSLPTVEQCLAAVREQVRAEIPAIYDVESTSSLPDYGGATPKGHIIRDGHWISTSRADSFSAGFRILFADTKAPLKTVVQMGGQSVWVDYLVVIQSVQ